MLKCIGNALLTAVYIGVGLGFSIGLFLGPVQSLSKYTRFRQEWEDYKKKHGGALKAWAVKSAPYAIIIGVVYFIFILITCFWG